MLEWGGLLKASSRSTFMRYKPGLLAKVDHIAFLKPVPLILKSGEISYLEVSPV